EKVNDDDDEEEISKIDEQEATESGGDDEETESDGVSEEEETTKKEEESFDPILRTPKDGEDDGNGEEDQVLRISEEERMHKEEEADELYRDVDINQGRGLQVSQDIEDSHVTLTPTHYIESIFMIGSSIVTPIPSPKSTMNPYIITTTTTASQPLIPPTPIPSDVLQTLLTFASVFRFEDRVKSLEVNFSEFMRTNQSPEAVYNIPEVLTRSSHSSRTSYAVAADLSKMELKKILIYKMEGNKEAMRKTMIRKDPLLDQTGGLRDEEKEGSMHQPSLHLNQLPRVQAGLLQGLNLNSCLPPRRPPTPDREWNKTLPAAQGNAQSWISALTKQTDARSSFNELLDTPIDFSIFIMNWLGVDTLTPELLAGPTYELIRGSCNSLTELEYHLKEVYKATTDQLDLDNPEDYGHIKWIEDLVPHFYEFAVNRESALDVYSKRRIIAVTDLKIVEWHNYKHLDWISVRRDDDKIYKFKEGDFKRLRLQDIEDMLLLLVQGKLSNLTVEERFAFNVSLRMFTRSIVIHRRVEDLQLGVESYQKRLNLIKPDTYRSDLKRREAYTVYSNPRGFIYQNRDKKNRLMRIDELHKFSDGTLNDARNALDDHLKGIKMQYLPTTI
nr:hypothetical protein [Tanacetum cinerariifolium]